MNKKVSITKRQRETKAATQRYDVLKIKDKISPCDLSLSSKVFIIPLPPHTPKEARKHHFPNRTTPWPARGLPTVIQLNNTSRHNRGQPKRLKKVLQMAGATSQ